MSFTPEVIVAAPADRTSVPMTSQVRSTLLGSSILSLRSAGHYDTYVSHLDPALRESILFAPAATWLPIDLGLAHYRACDALGLGPNAILEMGNAVAELTQKSVFSFAAALAREAGANPLTLAAMTPRLWSRLFVGGGVYAARTGPKDLRLEVFRASLATTRYWRVGLRGLLAALFRPFARQLFAREIPTPGDETTVAMSFSWV